MGLSKLKPRQQAGPLSFSEGSEGEFFPFSFRFLAVVALRSLFPFWRSLLLEDACISWITLPPSPFLHLQSQQQRVK